MERREFFGAATGGIAAGVCCLLGIFRGRKRTRRHRKLRRSRYCVSHNLDNDQWTVTTDAGEVIQFKGNTRFAIDRGDLA